MVNAYKYTMKKGFITPIVLVTMLSLFLVLAYNVPKIYGVYKNIGGLGDTQEEKDLEVVQGYLRCILKEVEISSKDDIITAFNNKDINLSLKGFKIFFDNNKKLFVKSALKKEVLFLDFDFDPLSERVIFIPIEKGELYNDF